MPTPHPDVVRQNRAAEWLQEHPDARTRALEFEAVNAVSPVRDFIADPAKLVQVVGRLVQEAAAAGAPAWVIEDIQSYHARLEKGLHSVNKNRYAYQAMLKAISEGGLDEQNVLTTLTAAISSAPDDRSRIRLEAFSSSVRRLMSGQPAEITDAACDPGCCVLLCGICTVDCIPCCIVGCILCY